MIISRSIHIAENAISFFLWLDNTALGCTVSLVLLYQPYSYWFRQLERQWVLVTHLRPTLCEPMDCSPPGSSVHGILKARIPEWVAITSSTGSSQPRDWTWVSCIAGGFFTVSATREAQRKHHWPPRKVIMKTPGKKSQSIGFGVSKVKVQTWNEKLCKNMKPDRTIVPIIFPFLPHSPPASPTPHVHTHTHTHTHAL